MKKYLLIVSVFVLGLSVVACGGKKGENAKEGDETQVEISAECTEKAEVLVKYEELLIKGAELQEKVKAGDLEAAQDYVKLLEEMAGMVEEVQAAFEKLTPEEAQKIEELVEKLAAAAGQ